VEIVLHGMRSRSRTRRRGVWDGYRCSDSNQTAPGAVIRYMRLACLRGRLVLVVAIVVSIWCAGCSHPWRIHQPSDPDPEVVAVVVEVGQWVLPPDATAVAVEVIDSLDNTYSLTLEMPPASVDVLLRESRFTAPLEEASWANSTWTARQQVPRPPGEDSTDLRLVTVNLADPHRAVVYLQVWT
jgi:hypothetical protein